MPRHKKPKPVYVVHAILYLKDVDGQAVYRTRWVDHEELTEQPHSSFPDNPAMQNCLDRVKAKGTNKGKMTIVGVRGIGTRSSMTETELKIRFQAMQCNCIPYALLNVLDASGRMRTKLLRALGGTRFLGDLTDLAGVSWVLKVRLRKCKQDLAWVLRQNIGRFLLFQSLHCVGVNCAKQLVYDSLRSNVLRLTASSLAACGFSHQEELEIREVVE